MIFYFLRKKILFLIAQFFSLLTLLFVFPDSFRDMPEWIRISLSIAVLTGWIIIIGIVKKEINIKKEVIRFFVAG